MASHKNQYNLSRRIPDSIKLQVRQRCGFGCVLCGSVLVEYHHFDPEFVDATAHNPEGITLLCNPHHNETLKKKTALTADEVREANANPHAKRYGANKISGMWRNRNPSFVVGWTTIRKNIYWGEHILFGVMPPEFPGGAVRITANLWDQNMKLMLSIQNNEWKFSNGYLDIHETGNDLTIKLPDGRIALKIEQYGEGKIIIKELHSRLPSGAIFNVEDGFVVTRTSGTRLTIGGEYDTMGIKPDGSLASG